MSFLRYVEGAIPGKTLKRKASDEDKKAKCRKYEETRVRSFNPKWRDGRTWLMHDTEENVMTCKLCSEQYAEGKKPKTNLKGQNKFVTGCSNFKVSAVILKKELVFFY